MNEQRLAAATTLGTTNRDRSGANRIPPPCTESLAHMSGAYVDRRHPIEARLRVRVHSLCSCAQQPGAAIIEALLRADLDGSLGERLAGALFDE